MELNYLIGLLSVAKSRKKGQKRTVYLYNKATKENQKNYKKELEKQICRKVVIKKVQSST